MRNGMSQGRGESLSICSSSAPRNGPTPLSNQPAQQPTPATDVATIGSIHVRSICGAKLAQLSLTRPHFTHRSGIKPILSATKRTNSERQKSLYVSSNQECLPKSHTVPHDLNRNWTPIDNRFGTKSSITLQLVPLCLKDSLLAIDDHYDNNHHKEDDDIDDQAESGELSPLNEIQETMDEESLRVNPLPDLIPFRLKRVTSVCEVNTSGDAHQWIRRLASQPPSSSPTPENLARPTVITGTSINVLQPSINGLAGPDRVNVRTSLTKSTHGPIVSSCCNMASKQHKRRKQASKHTTNS